MSKILDAMKMAARDGADLPDRLRDAGMPELHPCPVGRQAREIESISDRLVNALEAMAGGGALVVASARPGEGASFISYNCARTIQVLSGRPVVWVDGNARHPHAGLEGKSLKMADLLSDPGLYAPPPDRAGSLTIITGLGAVAKRIAGDEYAALLARFAELGALVVIDGPAVLEGIESMHLARGTAGIVLVVEAQRLKREIVRHAIEIIQSQGVEVLGTVLNRRRYDLPSFLYRRL